MPKPKKPETEYEPEDTDTTSSLRTAVDELRNEVTEVTSGAADLIEDLSKMPVIKRFKPRRVLRRRLFGP